MRVVSFTPGQFTPLSNSPRYPLDRKLGGPQSRSRRDGEEKKFHHWICREVNPCRPAHSLAYTECAVAAPKHVWSVHLKHRVHKHRFGVKKAMLSKRKCTYTWAKWSYCCRDMFRRTVTLHSFQVTTKKQEMWSPSNKEAKGLNHHSRTNKLPLILKKCLSCTMNWYFVQSSLYFATFMWKS